MAHIFTVDASVFLNAFNPYEAGHETSHRVLKQMQEQAIPIIVPILLLPEVAAAIGRGHRNPTRALEFVAALARLPHLILIPMDTTLAWQAVEIAAQHRLRGSDAIYAAVALRFGSTLVTLDREQRERVAAALNTRYPAEVSIEPGAPE
jgi:predicted nucleic acid-binding protein